MYMGYLTYLISLSLSLSPTQRQSVGHDFAGPFLGFGSPLRPRRAEIPQLPIGYPNSGITFPGQVLFVTYCIPYIL